MYVFAKSSDHPLTETVLKKRHPTTADKPSEQDKKNDQIPKNKSDPEQVKKKKRREVIAFLNLKSYP